MTRIKIKNFGPLRQGRLDNNGWIDIKKVSLFIGNQGSGKSCVAKLVSTFMWIEKALTRGDYSVDEFSSEKFRKHYCGYHRIELYFYDDNHNDVAEIEYEGEAFTMKYYKGDFEITKRLIKEYHLPQIMYVPAERNFISIVKEAKSFKTLPDSLLEYLTEFNNAKNEIKDQLALPINDAKIEYDKQGDVINVTGNDYKVELSEASSGFQSLVPLYLVSWYLANTVRNQVDNPQKMSSIESSRFNEGVKAIWSDKNLTEEQRRIALSALSFQFNKTAFINIVEEPEQNLYPVSQSKILYSLLEMNNLSPNNKLVITTHSPYIINDLSLSVKAKQVEKKTSAAGKIELSKIVPLCSLLDSDDLVIYQISNTGEISKLVDYQGLPSDENFLNELLAESSNSFANLLDIEDKYGK